MKNKNKNHAFGSFTLGNRLNLKSKITVLTIENEDGRKKEVAKETTCNDRLKELQSSLNNALEAKKDGKHDIDGVPLSSILEIRTEAVTAFLTENSIFPSDKGFEVICQYADNSVNLPKDFPKFGIDFVYSVEQKRILEGIFSTDKTWLNSEKGNESEKAFLSEMTSRGSIGKRAFSITSKNGKARIKGGYQIESDFDDDLEKKFFERQNQKNHFGLLSETKEKPIEQKTCKELRLECKMLKIPTKGLNKSQLIEKLS